MQCQHQKRAGLLMNNHSNWVQYLCGKMKNAWRAFDEMPSHCVVYCGTGTCEMQAGSECGRQKFDKCNRRYEASLCHFHRGSEMSREWPHDLIIQTSCMSSVFVGSNLIDIYCKCGCIEDAGRAFHNNVVSWTAIINGYAFHLGGGLLYNFKWICQEGIKINNVAFVIVILQSCGPSVSSPAL